MRLTDSELREALLATDPAHQLRKCQGAAVKGLSDLALAWLLLRQVYRIQDSGGISCGRARRNVIFEAGYDLIPDPVFSVDSDTFSLPDLVKEGERRSKRLFKYRPVKDSVCLSRLHDRRLAYLLLVKARDENRNEECEPLWEQSLLKLALRLLDRYDPGERFKGLTAEDLVKEKERRVYQRRKGYRCHQE